MVCSQCTKPPGLTEWHQRHSAAEPNAAALYDPLSLRLRTLPRLLLPFIALFGLTACGVEFSSTFTGTELFKGIAVTGDMHPGNDLTVTVNLNPTYPVPVTIACFYEDESNLTEDEEKIAFHDRARLAGRASLESPAGAAPGDDREREEMSFTFRVDQPGDYFIACLTPAAPDNGLGASFTVRP